MAALSENITFVNQSNEQSMICVGLGLLSVVFGRSVYRKVEGVEARKWTGTVLGLIICSIVFGVHHFWHMVLMTFFVAAVVKRIRNDKCHLMIFALMIFYSILFRIYFRTLDSSQSNQNVNIILMLISCKLAGVAFEINNKQKAFPNEDSSIVDPSYGEIIHYCFCYIGMLVGPYVRYRTYDDFIKLPHYKYAHDNSLNLNMLSSSFYFLLFAVCDNIWPLKYAVSDEFSHNTMLYKLTYAVIQYQIFKFWMYGGLVLSECICSAAGFGAYPIEMKSVYAHGPTEKYKMLSQMSEDDAKKSTYDFNTNSNIGVYSMQTCPWLTKHIREWNKSIQYFMGMYVYKSIPKSGFLKPFRALLTLIVCGVWHGEKLGFTLGLIIIPMYIATDKLYIKIHSDLRGWKSYGLSVVMYVVQFYIISFGIIAFRLGDSYKVLKYYSAVKWLPPAFIPIVHVIGLVVQQIMKLRL